MNRRLAKTYRTQVAAVTRRDPLFLPDGEKSATERLMDAIKNHK